MEKEDASAKRRTVAMVTVAVWCLIALLWAYLYGRSGLTAAAAAPEDSNWTWEFWVLMFAIFRLPFLLLGLAAVLFAEFQLLKGDESKKFDIRKLG